MLDRFVARFGSGAVAVGLGVILAQAAAPATPQGFITGKAFLNIGGTVVADLTGNAKFPDKPDQVLYPTYFEWNPAADINTPANNAWGENYGCQMIGYFYPPASGDYTFWVCADDGANLYLSTDDNPANKKLIAREVGWSNPRQWDTANGGPLEDKNSSTFTSTEWPTKDAAAGGAKITLQANKAYYIEALMKEGGGGDNLAVAVAAPNGSIDQTLPIPGSYLSPAGVAATPTITSQPADAAVYAGGNATFSVGLDIPPSVTLTSIKWTKNGADVPDSNNAKLVYKATAADNGAKFKAIITTSAGTLTSAEATMSVATFTPEFAPGVVLFEAYTDISGTAVDNLTSSDKFIAGTPDEKRLIVGINSPDAYGDNYGAKVSGFIIPPETAKYYFFVRSDDASQLWLSTDDKEANAAMVAEETDCCDAFMEPSTGDAATTAEPIALTAGKKYAFYVLLKEGGGGDWMQVTARKEGDAAPASSLQPLSGAWVGANAKPNLGDPQITKQPLGQPRLIEGRTLKLTAAATVTPAAYNFPAMYQWQKDGQNIAGATSATFEVKNASAANSGTYKVVVSAPSGKSVTSAEAVVNVVPDTFPPEIAGAGAIASASGNTFDVGVTFDEPVDAASAGNVANYSLSAGTITGIKYYASSPGVVLTATGLTAGATYTVTVKNVADALGNKITIASKTFALSPMKWGIVGANELKAGNGVVVVAPDGFDLYSDGMTEWAAYDEATFVYEEITGDFDKVLRVEYQDNSSQWARAGLIAREVLNFGVGRDEQGAGAAGRYQKCHVNPVGPTLTGPGNAGNGGWETNRRLETGGQTSASGGGGGPVPYPNAWCRIKRSGQTFEMFRSSDGQNWVSLGITEFPEPMPAKLYVGPEFSPENGNITEEASRGMWVAKIREYGNYPVKPPTPPSLREYSIGMNFGSSQAGGALTATDVAGVPAVAQANWNNMAGQNGTNVTGLVADAAGTAEATSVSVSWVCNNLWSSTGAGEENNKLTGADKILMTGYLDTGNATTTKVTINGIPAKLTDKGYDLYVYAMGGVGGRGGSYRIWDASTGLVIRDAIRAQSPTNLTEYLEVLTNLGATGNGAGTLLFGAGNYLVFKGLTAPNIIVEARTAAAGGGVGFSGTPRAPINALQLVAPSVGPVTDDVTIPVDSIAVTSPTSRSPAAEQVPLAIDNNSLTKFLDFNAPSGGSPPFKGPVGFTVRSSAGASVVTGLALTSANDAPERDPIDYKLEGSNDGKTFTLISEGAVPAFAKRFTRQVISFSNTAAYTSYRFTVANVANNSTANSMQIAEVEFLGKVTTPAPKITSLVKNEDGSLTLTWTGGGVLQAAPAVTGPWQDVAGAASPYKLSPTQAALFGRVVVK